MFKLIFLDTETTGLDWDVHRVIELAYLTERDDEPNLIYPYPTTNYAGDPWSHADPKALEINRIKERFPNGIPGSSANDMNALDHALIGATLVGANVQFDARMIANTLYRQYRSHQMPWHFRLFDMQAYVAGFFKKPELTSWAECITTCNAYAVELGIEPVPETNDHSAGGDALTVKRVYELLQVIAYNERENADGQF